MGSIDISTMTASEMADKSKVTEMLYLFTVSPLEGSDTRISVSFDWKYYDDQEEFVSKSRIPFDQLLNYTIRDVSLKFECDLVKEVDRSPLPYFNGEIDPKFYSQFRGIDFKHSLIQKETLEFDNSIPIHPTHRIDDLATKIDPLLKYWIHQVERQTLQKNNWLLTLGYDQKLRGEIHFNSEECPFRKIKQRNKRDYPRKVRSMRSAQTNRLLLTWKPNLENEDERIDAVYLAFWYSSSKVYERPIEFPAHNETSQLPWLEFHSKDYPDGHAAVDLSNIPFFIGMHPVWVTRKGNEFWLEEGDDLIVPYYTDSVKRIGTSMDTIDVSTSHIVSIQSRDFHTQITQQSTDIAVNIPTDIPLDSLKITRILKLGPQGREASFSDYKCNMNNYGYRSNTNNILALCPLTNYVKEQIDYSPEGTYIVVYEVKMSTNPPKYSWYEARFAHGPSLPYVGDEIVGLDF